MTTIAEYAASKELMGNLTLRELRGKYKRSVLGWAWSLLNPLATMLIFTLVFRFILKVVPPRGSPSGTKSFALFLLCGLLAWNYLTNGVGGGIGALVANANLVKKTYFPRDVLIGSFVVSCLVSLLIELGLLCAVLAIFGNNMLPFLPVTLGLVAVLTLFVTGLALFFSALNVYFRDVQHLVSIMFQVWFYLTPIVYPLTYVPIKANLFGHLVPVRALYSLNPMVGFVECFRDLLYDLRLPSLVTLGYVSLVSGVTFLAGLFIFNKLEGRMAEEL
ncbi:MAG TPA: ABC transporter permease [Acidimicrobiales bacterium]|nr:ABC transporter permease [Acidimicrobiales bacterium]